MIDLNLFDLVSQYNTNFPAWGVAFLFSYCLILILSLEKGARKGIILEDVFNLVLVATIGALLGGRVSYLLIYQQNVDWPTILSWGEIFYKGNMNIVGGYLGGIVAAWFYLKAFDVVERAEMSWLRFFDSFLYIIPLGLSFGYIGVFFSNIYKGSQALADYPWLLPFNDSYIHPWGLYLSIGYLIIFVLLYVLNQRIYNFRRPGYITTVFLILVSSMHFIVDFWQTSNIQYGLPRVIGLTITQWFSLSILFVTGLVALFLRARAHTEEFVD
ncbi:MAG: prolipoprotein diacylglyceryltransferase [Candidatus Parcubacteria bacterium]|jgi:phosphatidylglycerol:prolipoprotein diacylglycerol transferase